MYSQRVLRILASCLMLLGLACLYDAPHANAQDTAKPSWLNPSGMTVETRFQPPPGFTRKTYEDPYTAYMRNLPMLPDGSPVYLFNGQLKARQDHHVGVLDISVGDRDLQQCSDAAQRLRTDFLYQTKQFDKINYHFVNGMSLPWTKWRDGWRVKRDGKKTVMVKSAKASSGAETFKSYQKMLFMYAGVISVMKESPKITVAEMQPGDAIAGTGHLIIILDVVENERGEKKFLLAQSYIPAQQIEVLTNPYSDSPWYDAKLFESCPFVTPEWVYDCPGPNIYRLL
ncbi:MAG: hypothetical protein IKY83_04115 [Proteobacteria bacterium]|nr:hypothetical protein [Pseudomonadota bacterium]